MGAIGLLDTRLGSSLAGCFRTFLVCALLSGVFPLRATGDDATASARARMVTEIEANAAAVGKASEKIGISAPVLDVMGRIHRHLFAPNDKRRFAYEARPFPIGLADTANGAPELVPWPWDINGCAQVLSAVLATLLAIHFGFSWVIVQALVL